LDNCLQCLSCQVVCPSQVSYSEIIYQGQQIIFEQQQKGLLEPGTWGDKFLEYIVIKPRFKKFYIRAFNILVKLKLLKHLKFLAKKLSIRSSYYLPNVAIATNPNVQLAQETPTGSMFESKKVNIFTGCGNSLFDPNLLEQLPPLLSEMGLSIHEINSNSCCGAIFQRNGDVESLSQCNKANQLYYAHNKLPILSLTSACSTQLKKEFQHNSHDICTYLGEQEYLRFQSLQFKPLKEKIIVHAACSLRNQLHEQEFLPKLLSHIPQLELVNLLSHGCCGAAGNYMLTHPLMAEKIAEPYIQAIIESDCHVLLSTNISCALHIRAQLEKQGYELEIKHPISLLSQQLNLTRN